MSPLRALIGSLPFIKSNPELKNNLKSIANRTGIIDDEPLLEDFYVNSHEIPEKTDDDFSKIFYDYKGDGLIQKWGHYLPVYSRLFGPYRAHTTGNRPLRFLEIGVSKGGSLDIWRSYFGGEAVIYGIDINPACAAFDGKSAQVRIGSQADPNFLVSVVKEMGGIDIVLDDGSHVAEHQRISFETLFPHLSADGLYVVEDLHCAYWPTFGGGFRRKGSFVEITKNLIDDVHHWYHRKPKLYEAIDIGGIHIYDSIIAFEKSAGRKPFHTRIGGQTKEQEPG